LENKVGISVIKDLEEKSKIVKWKNNNRNEHFILFSINGFTDELIEIAKTRDNLALHR
jgi:uncharacterized protein